MLIEPDYRGYRIEVNAVAERDRFNAEVRIRRHAVHEKPHVEIVSRWEAHGPARRTGRHAGRHGGGSITSFIPNDRRTDSTANPD